MTPKGKIRLVEKIKLRNFMEGKLFWSENDMLALQKLCSMDFMVSPIIWIIAQGFCKEILKSVQNLNTNQMC
eukprot:TRINITY_DN5132_c0_g1_i1.p1 TRINITY_DN5132_c0_g1~~TRINITY_DN5132_c0_g1_i1.p1  ORF type:complete len:72 (+),score=7.23 TRINITY_DN5132_c0_g1_i1:146-361(+)